ncbi:MAG: Ig-like domain-containing protein [Chloroflexota bacterium]|nr:Ig-like domain-containing protein [Chloroflexota bacterium]
MRKFAAAVLALPILLPIYVPILLRRSIALRVGLALGVGGVLGLGALGILSPRQTVAVPASTPAPVASTDFGPVVRAGVAPNAGLDVTFSQAMDRASVAAAVSVNPAATISLAWDAASTSVTITPTGSWAPATLYSITVGATATDATGHQLGDPTRAAVVTRAATRAKIEPTAPMAKGVAARTGFLVTFDHPVDLSTAQAAFHIDPTVKGTIAIGDAADGASFTFTPSAPLDPKVAYRVSLTGSIADLDGSPVQMPAMLSVKAVAGPSVVRFRPRNGWTDIARVSRLSVRFTQPMERKSTVAAWSATANGTKLTGTFLWGENDTVLAFLPSKAFPAGAKIVMTVGAGATSKAGIPLDKLTSAHATVAKAVKKPSGGGSTPTQPIPRGSGGTVGAGTWYAVETYYLKLMNCTRTGGWVISSGACSSPGGLSTPPIILDKGLSDKVARPYAKLLATGGGCTHFANGSPTDRLRRAGYSGWAAENVGCRAAPNGFASVLGTHLYFQTEKPCGGYCHYANMMNPAYKKCGIGVWIANGRVRLVIDFYHS